MKDSWAVVTGASSGIGKEMAKQLAQKGFKLILVARRLPLLEELAATLKVETICIPSDLAREEECRKVYSEATKNREIQVLINNAGIGNYGTFLSIPLEQHLNMMNLNMRSLTIITHLFGNHMLGHRKRSYILNVASIAAFQTIPKFGTYCGSKKYVKDLTETLAFELRDSNISVTCLSPGGTYTEFMANSGQVLKSMSAPFMMRADTVARVGLNAMFSSKLQKVPGFLNLLTTTMVKFIPDRFKLKVAYFFYSKAVDEIQDQ